MFELLQTLPADPILGLIQLYKNDPSPNKVDLGVGVYKNDFGQTPVLESVRRAEAAILAKQVTKNYVGPAGNERFLEVMKNLILGVQQAAANERWAAVQTPGGCGALRIAAELIKAAAPAATIWVSAPTWGNHIPLLGSAGLAIQEYAYLSQCQTGLDWPAMQASLSQVKRGDVVLLHASCHNPTGVDLGFEHWQWLANLALEKGFLPLIDMAYQGFGKGLDQDAAGLRWMVESLPELVVAVSCSKNFGLYRERVGMVASLCQAPSAARAAESNMQRIVRGIYSMPPDHGAAIVGELLTDPGLVSLWKTELHNMRSRIQGLRNDFATNMTQLNLPQFEFVREQQGMFSYLGISPTQVDWLAKNKSIYLLRSSRASIAGLSHASLDYVCNSFAQSLAEAD
jgi:aspartate aminotransferase